MSPTLKTALFVSVALASFAGAANASSYKRLHLDGPLMGSMGSAYDEITDYAADAELGTIAKAAKAAMELIEDEDVVETLLGDELE